MLKSLRTHLLFLFFYPVARTTYYYPYSPLSTTHCFLCDKDENALSPCVWAENRRTALYSTLCSEFSELSDFCNCTLSYYLSQVIIKTIDYSIFIKPFITIFLVGFNTQQCSTIECRHNNRRKESESTTLPVVM